MIDWILETKKRQGETLGRGLNDYILCGPLQYKMFETGLKWRDANWRRQKREMNRIWRNRLKSTDPSMPMVSAEKIWPEKFA